jgi:hypothetical protein
LTPVVLFGQDRSKDIYIPERGEWFHFEAGAIQLMPQSEELKQEFSYSLGFEFLFERLFGRSHYSWASGIGFSSFHYNNNLNIETDPISQKSVYTFLSPDTARDMNRQVLQYLEIPIELRYRSRPNKKGRYFRFYPQVKVGYQVRSYNHFVDGNYSVVQFGIQDMNRWRFSAGLRTGFWIFNLYTSYEFTPLYDQIIVGETDLSKFRTLTVGLSVSL